MTSRKRFDKMSDSMSEKDLGRLIFRERYKKGLTQQKLAQQADMSADYISKLESGIIKKPSPRALLALSKALGIDMDTLLDNLLK
jgi:transcriptional regulator with XRE-family HTH domain